MTLPLHPRPHTRSRPAPEAFRGCRTCARKLDLLDEFWGLVCQGDLHAALSRLELEEERARRRRAEAKWGLLVSAFVVVAAWSLVRAL
jgi:hypothetical protein